ncbi:MAG TPA: DUF2203 domain-containing protein [Methylomirabilota bacterium]|nr:DUF2203 domain-containing protein [Methylomirabilota bacterium]
MPDEEQDNAEEQPHRLFTLHEAEIARKELEPFLVEAMSCRKRLSSLDVDLSAAVSRIMVMGGILVPYEKMAKLRIQHRRLTQMLKAALERISSAGCVVKDLEVGLLDFPSVVGNEEVYLCWKLGEDRIRFYHRQDEGFAGRKPLDPEDLEPGDVQ